MGILRRNSLEIPQSQSSPGEQGLNGKTKACSRDEVIWVNDSSPSPVTGLFMRTLLRPQMWLRALEAVQSLPYMPFPKVQHAQAPAHYSISRWNLPPVTLPPQLTPSRTSFFPGEQLFYQTHRSGQSNPGSGRGSEGIAQPSHTQSSFHCKPGPWPQDTGSNGHFQEAAKARGKG